MTESAAYELFTKPGLRTHFSDAAAMSAAGKDANWWLPPARYSTAFSRITNRAARLTRR